MLLTVFYGMGILLFLHTIFMFMAVSYAVPHLCGSTGAAPRLRPRWRRLQTRHQQWPCHTPCPCGGHRQAARRQHAGSGSRGSQPSVSKAFVAEVWPLWPGAGSHMRTKTSHAKPLGQQPMNTPSSQSPRPRPSLPPPLGFRLFKRQGAQRYLLVLCSVGTEQQSRLPSSHCTHLSFMMAIAAAISSARSPPGVPSMGPIPRASTHS